MHGLSKFQRNRVRPDDAGGLRRRVASVQFLAGLSAVPAENRGDLWSSGFDGLNIDLKLKESCEELRDLSDAAVPFGRHRSQGSFVLTIFCVDIRLLLDEKFDQLNLPEKRRAV